MNQVKGFAFHPGWRILLTDLGIRPADVLRRAGLPDDLFTRENASLNCDEYFSLWRGVEEESADPKLPLRIGEAISVEIFDPPIFAALCSPDLNTALRRISLYKKLIGPMVLKVEVGEDSTALELVWPTAISGPPVSLAAVELIFFVKLARLATRFEVRPIRVTTANPPAPVEAYTDFFRVEVTHGPTGVVFSAEDAARPFLTANDKMWRFFEPELRKRLSELNENAAMSERVRAALLELLPSGNATMEAVSKKLRVGSRTLQRRLNAEGGKFQVVLNKTREELARHYLKSSAMSGAEISFLLGFEDPNSFSRAFHTWTGETPEQARASMRGAFSGINGGRPAQA
jgi:AraC-like DNA-binding protein